MKSVSIKRAAILIMLLIFTAINAQNKSKSLLGKWQGTDERSQGGAIEFLPDSKAKVMVMGMQIPIDEYKMDDSKDPIQMMLIVKRNGQTMNLYGLIKFIDNDTIKWEVFPMAQQQPIAFSDNAKDTSVVLKRQK